MNWIEDGCHVTERIRSSPDEVQFVTPSFVEQGRIFRWKGRLFRAIRAEHSDDVRRLFSSGLVDALVREGLFIPSQLTAYEIDGFELVIEHQMIDVVSYPREWSFSMLKDAALLVLRVNEVAIGFGYQLKRCHAYNVRFVGECPLYIDLESFIPFQQNALSMLALDEFIRTYQYPILIWSSIGVAWGSRAVQRPGFLLDTEDYLRCRWPIFRYAIADPIGKALSKVYRVCSWTDERFSAVNARHPAWKAFLAERGRRFGRARASIEGMRHTIQRVHRRADKTAWSDYQGGFARQDGEMLLSPRFQTVVDVLMSLGVSSILEIAGNQGLLSRTLKRLNPSLRITCTDGDELALDRGFCASKSERLGINWAVLNPVFTELATGEESPAVRFQADAVVVMALTHHLVLSHGLPLGWVLDQLSLYCRSYLLIEFMPLGVTTPNAPPAPAWYTQEWFQNEFEARFDCIQCTQLEKNRVLFVGRRKATDSAIGV